PPAAGHRIVRKGGGIEFGAAPIPRAHMGARDDDLADFTAVCLAPIVTSDQNAHALGTSPNRDDRAGWTRTPMLDDVLCDDARLGSREMVDENAALQRMFKEQVDIAVEHGFAAEVDGSKMGE